MVCCLFKFDYNCVQLFAFSENAIYNYSVHVVQLLETARLNNP